jgi:phage shock protein A
MNLRHGRRLVLPAFASAAIGAGVTAWLLGIFSTAPQSMPLLAPRAGLAGDVRVREGELDERGAPILLFDPLASAAASRMQALMQQLDRVRAELALLPSLHGDRIGLLQSRLAQARRMGTTPIDAPAADLAELETELAELRGHARSTAAERADHRRLARERPRRACRAALRCAEPPSRLPRKLG